MNIQYLSDLHLEYQDNRDFLRSQHLKVTGDILILAGDIFYLGEKLADSFFLKWASDHYEHVLLIPGNHEFYDGFDLAENGPSWQLRIMSKVRYCYNKVVTFGNIDLAYSLKSHTGHLSKHRQGFAISIFVVCCGDNSQWSYIVVEHSCLVAFLLCFWFSAVKIMLFYETYLRN